MKRKPEVGFFRDDGTEIDPALIRKPELCLSCKKDSDPKEEILCMLNREDQEGEKEFRCYAYQARSVNA